MGLGYLQLRYGSSSAYIGMGNLRVSPDGKWLAFNNSIVGGSDSPTTDIFALNSVTGQIGPIVSSLPNLVGRVAWHPSMNWLAIHDPSTNHAWVYPFNSSTGALGTRIQAPNLDGYSYWQTVLWSPDGNSLIGEWSNDYAFGSGNPVTTIRGYPFNPGTGLFGTQFSGTGFGQTAVQIMDVSPDGNYLLLKTSHQATTYAIVVLAYSSATGPGSPVLNGGSGNTDSRFDEAVSGDVHFTRAYAARWTLDGKYVMFSSNAAGDGQPLSICSWSTIGPTFGTRIAPPGAAPSGSLHQTISADSTYIAFHVPQGTVPAGYYPAVFPWNAVAGTYGAQVANPGYHSLYLSEYIAFGGSPHNCVIAAGLGTLAGGGGLNTGSPWSWGSTSAQAHSTDALLMLGRTKTHSTDAYLQRPVTLTHSTDALLWSPTVTLRSVSHTTDAFLQALPQKAFTTDALLRKPGNLLVFGTDAFLSQSPIGSSIRSSECLPPVIDPLGRIGVGVNQPPGYALVYPLIDPTPDIQYLLADVQLTYEDPADYDSRLTPYAWPLSIAWLAGLGCLTSPRPSWAPTPVHAVDVLLTDHNGVTVFDSTQASYFYSRTWGPRLMLYEWRTATAVLRLQSYTAWSPDNTPAFQHYHTNIAPGSGGILDSRTWYRLPRRVKSLSVNGVLLTGAPVDFVNGYNTDFTTQVPAAHAGQIAYKQIGLDAGPGDGLGRYPGCVSPELDILTINKVQPNQYGDFLLAAGNCYWIRQPSLLVAANPRTALVSPATLQIGNDCGPCCDCSDFVTVYNQLTALAGQYQGIGNSAQQTKNELTELVTIFSCIAQCIQSHPMQLQVLSGAGGLISTVASFSNATDQPIGPVTLQLDLTHDAAAIGSSPVCGVLPTIQPSSVYVKNSSPPSFTRGTLIGSYPHVSYTWNQVRPRDFVSLRFVVQVANSAPAMLFATLTGSANNRPLLQQIKQSETTTIGC
jgi:hypothetical protein